MIAQPETGWWRRAMAYLGPFHWREAALCIPALVVLMVCGVLSGHVQEGMIAAGAAFSVGFGASRELAGWRWGAMLGAAVGMPLAAFTGTLAGQQVEAYVALGVVLAGACAVLALAADSLWWVVLQGVVAYLVAGYFPGDEQAALLRGALVLAGGVSQLLMVRMLARAFPAAAAPLPGAAAGPYPAAPAVVAYAVRAALAVGGSIWLVDHLHLPNGYWAALTALLVLKPGLRDTLTRGMARLGGTLAGCVLATLYAELTRDMTVALIAGTALAAGAAYALQKAHYAALTMGISAEVVLLISLVDRNALVNAEHRIEATLLGGALALAAAMVSIRLPRAVLAMYRAQQAP